MTKLQAISNLWKLVINLYDSEDDARRIASSSGLNVSLLSRGNNVADYWWNILTAAHKRSLYDAVVDSLSADWPERAIELADLYDQYRTGVDSSLPVSFVPQQRRAPAVRTGGGMYVGGNAKAGRDLIGRDQKKVSASKRKRERRQAANSAIPVESPAPAYAIDITGIIRSQFVRPEEVMALGVECHYCKGTVIPTSVPATPCGHCGNWNYWDKTAFCAMGKYLYGSVEVDAMGAVNGMSLGILVSDPTADNPDAMRPVWSTTCNVMQGG